ncbi:MAG: hypothetical protein AAFV29_19905, partial [Myxococcota bacterium]
FIDITTVIAGGAGGYLRTGHHVDCSANGRWDERLDTETNGPRIEAPQIAANVYDFNVGWIDGATSHNKVLTTVHNAVLPRDASGQPVNPIARFPEQDTADSLNTVESGEITQIRST